MREHGGNLDVAQQRFGGAADDWIDLSTGINRVPYPLVDVEPRHWSALPSRSDLESLHAAARQPYGTDAPMVAMGGAQAAIQLLPHLALKGRARILAPTYNEYAAVLSAAGWDVAEMSDLAALAGADIAVVVNPNNPDGRRHDRQELLALLHGRAARGRLRQARRGGAIAGLDAARRHAGVPALRDRRCVGRAGEACACTDLVAGFPAETGMAAPRLAGQRSRMVSSFRRAARLTHQREQAVDIEMGLDVLGKRIECGLDPGAVGLISRRDVELREESLAKFVRGEQAVQIAAVNAPVGRNRALSRTVE